MKLSIPKINEEKNKLMTAKTPEEYIERSLKSKLGSGQKGSITVKWLKKTNYTFADLQRARTNNSSWKEIKGKGSYARNAKRLEKYNFKGSQKGKKEWTKENLSELYDLNKTKKDWELAEHFHTSLPAINHIRRKFKLAKMIMEKKNEKIAKKKILLIIQKNEKALRAELNSL
ncbi:MAG: hypothetical protein H7A23_04920 [Leptospiraceae bacterium]|nr:hypothetical protein [Leptospiraceae bacterium]MCP5493878.1 hypothetical protein [Leptospiraceae bacterium]